MNITKTMLIISSVILVPVMILNLMNAAGQTREGLDMLIFTNSTTEIVSSVANVTVNGFEIKSPNSMDIDLVYSGPEKAPALKINSSAISINSDIINQMTNPNSTDFNASNSASSLGKLNEILSISNGTKSLDSGWKSPTTVTVDLNGNATLSKADLIGITVHG